VAHLWQVQALHELSVDVRETIAEVLGSEAASHGLDRDENPNAYGVGLGERFNTLGLWARLGGSLSRCRSFKD
jgi:hypothetical protein